MFLLCSQFTIWDKFNKRNKNLIHDSTRGSTQLHRTTLQHLLIKTTQSNWNITLLKWCDIKNNSQPARLCKGRGGGGGDHSTAVFTMGGEWWRTAFVIMELVWWQTRRARPPGAPVFSADSQSIIKGRDGSAKCTSSGGKAKIVQHFVRHGRKIKTRAHPWV